MRLIDAEEFKRQIAGMAIVSDYPPRKANALCELIDKQPTAYDVDKVVKELEEWSFDADIIVPTIPPSYSTIIHKNVIAKGNAIVIVKENIND